MSAGRWSATARLSLAGAIAVGILAIVRPWTTRPIETTHPQDFSASGFVDAAWNTRVLAEAERTAIALPAAVDPPAPPGGSPARRSLFVRGTAAVAEIDTRSRVGLARLAPSPGTPGPKIAIQIGPVIRGTALRDALDFIHFSDFDNQLQFAEVAGALNEHVRQHVLAAVDLEGLKGQTISFVGAVTVGSLPGDGTLEVVPVTLTVHRRAP